MKNFKTILFINLLLLTLVNCKTEKKPVDYHRVNQPICPTDDFFSSETFNVSGDKIAHIYNAQFYKGNRMAFWDMEFEERLMRSLKGNIKSLVMERYINSGREFTLHLNFDTEGKITKMETGYHNDGLEEATTSYDKYQNFRKDAIDLNSKDSLKIRDKDDFFSYTFYKGKPYAMYHLMGDLLNRYKYHSNGNRAFQRSYTSHDKMYFNKEGLLDSINKANSADQPTEIGKKYYTYKDGLVMGKREFDIKLQKPKNDTTRIRIQNAEYIPGSDLMTRVEDSDGKTKQVKTFTYNEKKELIRLIDIREQPFTDYSFTYEYDEKGNWLKATQKRKNKDHTKEPFVYLYKIRYEYY